MISSRFEGERAFNSNTISDASLIVISDTPYSILTGGNLHFIRNLMCCQRKVILFLFYDKSVTISY
jgi:hypothetical protein